MTSVLLRSATATIAGATLVVPELFASLPGGFTAAQVEQIGALAGVRAVLPVDGAQVSIDGVSANVLGVSPRAFRAWAPPAAADTARLLCADGAAAGGAALEAAIDDYNHADWYVSEVLELAHEYAQEYA